MTVQERYEDAKARYAALGIDTDRALEETAKIKISMHCWQGDDVVGFDQKGPLTGGIQTTGNYPYRATTPAQLMQDIDKVLTYIPGKHKLNLQGRRVGRPRPVKARALPGMGGLRKEEGPRP